MDNGTHWVMEIDGDKTRLVLKRTDTHDEVAFFEAELARPNGVVPETLVLHVLTNDIKSIDDIMLLLHMSGGTQSRAEEPDAATRLLRRVVHQMRGNFVLFANLSTHELQTRVFGWVKDTSRPTTPRLLWRRAQELDRTPIGLALAAAKDQTVTDKDRP